MSSICENITSNKYDHVPFIAVLYPIPFNEPKEVINQKLNSPEYKEALIDIVDYVKSFGLKVSMDTEGYPEDFPVPYIPNADLYGIMPFSPELNYMNTTYYRIVGSIFQTHRKAGLHE